MKTALVTGSYGFVGRHMCKHLDDLGWDVYTLDPADPQFHHGAVVLSHGGDFSQFVNYSSKVFDLVVHAAAAAPHRRAIDEQKANFPYNVMLDAAMFNWAITTKQKHVVYLSSSAVYSDELHHPTLGGSVADGMQFPFTEDMGFLHEPFDVYGQTKRIGERMAQQALWAGVPVTIVRPFSGYGEDQSEDFPFRAFIERARRRENPFTIWGDAGQVRDWIHIDDIVRGIMALVEARVTAPVNLCTGIETSMHDLARMIVEKIPEYEPKALVDANAPMGVRYRVGDPTLLNAFYTPTVTIEEGIKRALGTS